MKNMNYLYFFILNIILSVYSQRYDLFSISNKLSNYKLRSTIHDQTIFCNQSCVLDTNYWNRFSILNLNYQVQWPLSCGVNVSDFNTEFRLFFNRGLTWYLMTQFDPETTDDLCIVTGQKYIASNLNICNGACSDQQLTYALNNLSSLFNDWCTLSLDLSTNYVQTGQKEARDQVLELSPILDLFLSGYGTNPSCLYCDNTTETILDPHRSSSCNVIPMIECVSVNNDTCTSFWSYENLENEDIYMPIPQSSIYKNTFYDPADNGQPIFYQPGLNEGVFYNQRNCSAQTTQTWSLSLSNASSINVTNCPSPDRFSLDCNSNGVSDLCEIIYNELSLICDPNLIDPICLIAVDGTTACLIINASAVHDCNLNFIIDTCEIQSNSTTYCDDPICKSAISFELLPIECVYCKSLDLDSNGVPDQCQDCNNNGISDVEEIISDPSLDCNSDFIIDSCQFNFQEDDCNYNLIYDVCDIISGFSLDLDNNTIPDECTNLGACCISLNTCTENTTEIDCSIALGNFSFNQTCIASGCLVIQTSTSEPPTSSSTSAPATSSSTSEPVTSSSSSAPATSSSTSTPTTSSSTSEPSTSSPTTSSSTSEPVTSSSTSESTTSSSTSEIPTSSSSSMSSSATITQTIIEDLSIIYGSCCSSALNDCLNYVTDTYCDHIGGVFSLSTCESREDCVIDTYSEGNDTSLKNAIIIISIVSVFLVGVTVLLALYVWDSPNSQRNFYFKVNIE